MKTEPKVSKTAIVAATFARHPWLETNGQIVKETIMEVKFLSFIQDYLKAHPNYIERDGGDIITDPTPTMLTNRIFLHTKEGKLIGQVGVRVIPAHKETFNFLWIFPMTYTIDERTELFPETVGEALKRLDPDGKTFYIVGLLDDRRQKLQFDMFITSPAKGCETIRESLEAEMKQAEEIVKTSFA
ncbi:MAG: hypothetical protein WCO16_00800 [bacterium]